MLLPNNLVNNFYRKHGVETCKLDSYIRQCQNSQIHCIPKNGGSSCDESHVQSRNDQEPEGDFVGLAGFVYHILLCQDERKAGYLLCYALAVNSQAYHVTAHYQKHADAVGLN